MFPRLFSKAAKEITIRKLEANDAHQLRKLFLRALKTEGEMIGPTYEEEKLEPLSRWESRAIHTPDRAMFGMFAGKDLVGGMQVSKANNDEKIPTIALWGAAFVHKDFRGKGLARELYIARLNFTRCHPTYQRAITVIHEENLRSRAIHIKHGARHYATEQKQWPHRPAATWHWYEIPIEKL